MLPRSWNDAEERAGQLELPQGCAGAILGFDGWGDGPGGEMWFAPPSAVGRVTTSPVPASKES